MPALAHSCPKCSLTDPCYFSEGEIVSLRDEDVNAPWTGMILETRRDPDPDGRVYHVLWGPPPSSLGTSAAIAEKHSGQHRREELIRFLVPLIDAIGEGRVGGGGGREAVVHRFASPPNP